MMFMDFESWLCVCARWDILIYNITKGGEAGNLYRTDCEKGDLSNRKKVIILCIACKYSKTGSITVQYLHHHTALKLPGYLYIKCLSSIKHRKQKYCTLICSVLLITRLVMLFTGLCMNLKMILHLYLYTLFLKLLYNLSSLPFYVIFIFSTLFWWSF